MPKLSILAGTTSKTVDVFIQDSRSSVGAGLTGLVYNTGSLTAYYYREGANATVAISLATQTLGTWATGGFIVVDGTNMPGVYQLGVPDLAFASGAKSVVIFLQGAANMVPVPVEIELTAVNNQSAATFMTGVNGLAPPTNWNLQVIDGAGRLDISKVSGTSQTARDLGASVLLSAGTGTGQLDFTSGVVKANLAQILGTALTETAGQIAAAFKQFFNIASPTSTMNLVTAVTTLTTYTGNTVQTGDSYARLGAPAGASVSADIVAVKAVLPSGTTAVGTNGGLPTCDATNSVKIQTPVKRNTALANFAFVMQTTAGAFATGLTVTAQRSIDGGAFGSTANSVSELSNGVYLINLAAADLNGTNITLRFSAGGARDTFVTVATLP